MRSLLRAPALLGLVAACAPADPPRVAWTIDFAAGAPRPPEVTSVEAWIARDGCTPGDLVYSTVLTRGSTMAPRPPALSNGTWGFGADARDASCRVVARGCVAVDVPEDRRALVLLSAEAGGTGCTSPDTCVAGACVPGDAGPLPIDAGRDAGADGGRPDSGCRDGCPRDAGPRDAGRDACVPTGAELCSGGVDDDCDGLADCADGDCSMVCCTSGCISGGMCLPGTTEAACGRFGAPCMPCAGVCSSRGMCCTGDNCLNDSDNCTTSRDRFCGIDGAACVDCLAMGMQCCTGVCMATCP